jgi:hypothetical protein
MNIMGCRDPNRVATLAWSSMNDLALAQLASTHAENKSFEEALQLRAQRKTAATKRSGMHWIWTRLHNRHEVANISKIS